MADRLERLRELATERGRAVRVGIVGAGQMGRGLAAQVGRLDGLELAVVADIDAERARHALKLAGRQDVHDGLDDAARRIAEGGAVAVTDATAVADLPVDVVVEVTGVPLVGAQVAHDGLLAGQDVIMLNVETDVTIGRYLDDLSQRTGAVYSVADGDEPTVAKELVDLAHELSFDVVCAGKGKNNPFRPAAIASELTDEARRKQMNPKMLASFVDGSKTMIEMAALANATGLPPDVVGMHGPTAEVDELATTLVPREDGGLLSAPGRVDYAFGPAPGVFVVVGTDDETVADEMSYLSMGPGPYFTLYRPFHLASIEAIRTIVTAQLERRAAIRATTWTAEVVAVAKSDLPAGTTLEGIGGDHVRGVTYPAGEATDLLPLGLAEGAVLEESVRAGEPVTRAGADVPSSVISHLRALQELRAG